MLTIFLDLDVDDTPQKWDSPHGTYSTFALPVTNDQRGYTDDDFVLGCAWLFQGSSCSVRLARIKAQHRGMVSSLMRRGICGREVG